MSASEKKKEDWMNSKWRPMMGWMYMITCMADFVVFPILWSLIQALHGGEVKMQWQPITLQGAGLFHIAMGAVLGIAAYGRTQEKLGGANNGGLQLQQSSPVSSSMSSSFGAPSASFGSPSPSQSFAPSPMSRGPVTQPAFSPNKQTFVSSSGKPGPMPEPDPEL